MAGQYFESDYVGNNSIIKTTHKTMHATLYITGHVIKSSRLPPRFSVEEPGYETSSAMDMRHLLVHITSRVC